ncbi:MAG: DUF2459 domain-containing protein, partial [Bacteroidota bacterium]
MATSSRIKPKKVLRYLGRFFLRFLLLVVAYALFAFLTTFIPVNRAFEDKGPIEIFVVSNGVHTDICVPVQAAGVDWLSFVPDSGFGGGTKRYLSMGWGEEDFYLNTPSWSDLSIGTALSAIFLPTSTAMHVTVYRGKPITSEN